MTLTLGELCAGVGALGMALSEVIGCEPVWHAQFEPKTKQQYAAQILAHHHPGVPNHGDITTLDYAGVQSVDIIAAGFPCQDISLAGRRVGLMPGTRSGVWSHVARAIGELRPSLVFIENVRSLTSVRAHSDVEHCPWCMGDGRDAVALRALGAVLGDLADLGFDAEWTCVRASDVGAPHQRARIFVLAWPSAADPAHDGRERQRRARRGGLISGHVSLRLFVTPTAQLAINGGSQHPDKRRAGGHGPTLADQVEFLLDTQGSRRGVSHCATVIDAR